MWPRWPGLFAAAGTLTAASIAGSATTFLGSLPWGGVLAPTSKVAFSTANGASIGRDLVLGALGLKETTILSIVAASIAEAILAARFQGRCGTASFIVEVSASADDPSKVLGKARLDQGYPIALEKL